MQTHVEVYLKQLLDTVVPACQAAPGLLAVLVLCAACSWFDCVIEQKRRGPVKRATQLNKFEPAKRELVVRDNVIILSRKMCKTETFFLSQLPSWLPLVDRQEQFWNLA